MTKKSVRGSISSMLRAPSAPIDLMTIDPGSTPGIGSRGKSEVAKFMLKLAEQLSDEQERLYANGCVETTSPAVLVVLQGMDTSGKGGVVGHVFGLVNPQGLHLRAFKVPTKEELAHDFLWRVRKEVPNPGFIGIFDRSHYEDVLVVRVNGLVPAAVWQERYDQINDFESELTASGIRIIKCFLHISAEKQKERLLERLKNSKKHWKYNSADLEARHNWAEYMVAYQDVLDRCNPDLAPWYIIPSDHKWYRNWAIAQLLYEQLKGLNLNWPAGNFDLQTELRRVKAS